MKYITAIIITILLILISSGSILSTDKPPKPILEIMEKRCIACKLCLQNCPVKAISVDIDGRVRINKDVCITCGKCITLCPKNAVMVIKGR